MKVQMSKMASALVALALLLASLAGGAGAAGLDTAAIDSITGLQGKLNSEEGVYKVSQPRADIKITVDQWQMAPFMGLTSWAAFQAGMQGSAMVMGDLVLMQDEVNPAMSALLNNGLTVTALHNHFFYDEPRVYFMHLGGEGPVDKLARGVRAALDAVKQARAARSEPAKGFPGTPLPAQSSLSAAPLQQILASKGETKDGMFKAVFGRTVKMPCGCPAGKEMGVNTWAAFAGADDNALVDGDFVVLENELQPVLKSLRKSGINVVAIHHHMVGEEPRTIFLHYWGRGTAQDLARAVKTALSLTADRQQDTHKP